MLKCVVPVIPEYMGSLWFGVLCLLQGHRYLGWITSTHPRECEDSKAGDRGGLSFFRDMEPSKQARVPLPWQLRVLPEYSGPSASPLQAFWPNRRSQVSLYLPSFCIQIDENTIPFSCSFCLCHTLLSSHLLLPLLLFLSPHRSTSFRRPHIR